MTGSNLDEEIIDRVSPAHQGLMAVDCPECEYSGEDVSLQPDGSINCPDCDGQVLSAEQFEEFKEVWETDF